jgi:type II secretion system protein N
MMQFPRERIQRLVGYVVFGLFAFVFFLYLTFPYDVLQRRVISEAAAQGLSVRIGSMGPGFFGITADKLQIAKVMDVASEKPPEALFVDSVALRPALFPLGVVVRARAFGGTISASVGGLGTLNVDASFKDLDPEKGNLKAVTGVSAKGKLDGEVALELPKNAPDLTGKPTQPNLGEASGHVELNLDKFSIEGGTVTVPVMGTPTPVDLPRIVVGHLEASMKIDKGAAKLDKFHGKGDDLELLGSGTLKLARRLEYSEINLDFKLKAEPAFVSRLGLIGSGLSVLPADREAPGFRVAHLSGFLGQPSFQAGR